MGRKKRGGRESSREEKRSDVMPFEALPDYSQCCAGLEIQVEYLPVKALRGYQRNAKKHPKKQLNKLGNSIQEFGFVTPVLVDENGQIIAGHARCLVAQRLGIEKIPVVRLAHLDPVQVKALRIADNRLTELGEWDEDLLAIELADLLEVNFDVDVTGFEAPEIDFLLDTQLDNRGEQAEDVVPPLQHEALPVTHLGDLWRLGKHLLYCGDARDGMAYENLMRGLKAQLVITDPPYNVPIDGHATGAGQIHHREFVMASGDMTPQEFAEFLGSCVFQLARHSLNGALHYIFMDWRGLPTLQGVCANHYTRQVNLCVWAKTNGGMGSLYRSQHELAVVYQNGNEPHINNVHLGKYGRNRTNVWSYEGVNSLNAERRSELVMHPTVKLSLPLKTGPSVV